MKATELRIGCTYQSVKFNQPVTLTAEDIYELVNDAEGANIESYIKNRITPIPLIEEWLIKSPQIRKSKDREGVFYFGWMGIDRPIFVLVVDESGEHGWHVSAMVDKRIAIQIAKGNHLHTFQNLYFSLTGEELTIK